MAAYNKFNQFIADVFAGVHDFANDSFKIYLSNASPAAANTVKANIAEISAGNGYTAGGVSLPVTSATQTGGTLSVAVGAVADIAASGGAIGPFRYAIVYNDTSADDRLVAWFDYGSSITLNDGERLEITPSANLLTAS